MTWLVSGIKTVATFWKIRYRKRHEYLKVCLKNCKSQKQFKRVCRRPRGCYFSFFAFHEKKQNKYRIVFYFFFSSIRNDAVKGTAKHRNLSRSAHCDWIVTMKNSRFSLIFNSNCCTLICTEKHILNRTVPRSFGVKTHFFHFDGYGFRKHEFAQNVLFPKSNFTKKSFRGTYRLQSFCKYYSYLLFIDCWDW